MNRKQLFAAAAIALIGSTSAFAQEATSDAWMNAAATKARAEVVAATLAARQSGELGTINSEVYAFNAPGTEAGVRRAKSGR